MKKLVVLIAVFALVGAFAVTAMAQEWSFYGSARFQTFYEHRNEELTGTDDSDGDTRWEVDAATTRVGMKVSHGDVGGHVEMRANSTSDVRLWYGWWDFGSGKLSAGQFWSPLSTLYSNQAWKDKGMGSNGDNSYRVQQIWFDFPVGLKIALVNPAQYRSGPTGVPKVTREITVGTTASGEAVTSTATSEVSSDIDTYIPKIEFAYKLKASEAFTLDIGGGVNFFKFITEEGTSNEESYNILAYEFQAGVNCNFDPVYVKYQAYIAQNFGNYGGWTEEVRNKAIISGSDVEDVMSGGMEFIFGIKATDMVTIEGGCGVVASMYELNSVDHDEVSYTGYLQAKLTLAKGVYVIPEVGVYDYGERDDDGTKTEDGAVTYAGAKWQIDF